MIPLQSGRVRLAAGAVALLVVGTATGLGLGRLSGGADSPAPAAGAEDRKVLYWYDPMVPGQRFDKPGKSPYMDMPLVPRYADEGAGGAGVLIDPAQLQNLGVRYAMVERGQLGSELTASGVIDFNQRDVSVVQARADGFVQRVYARAPGDVVAAGAPLADILAPEWGGAQAEYLAVRRTGDAELIAAARQRLVLLGMPAVVIAGVERTGRPQTTVTVATPAGGVIRTLSVRAGMTVARGQTLAEVSGLGTVWLNAAVPEALAAQVRPGQSVTAALAAFPGEAFSGRVSAILPEVTGESRTLTARVELINRGGRLRPGMFGEVRFSGPPAPALLIPTEAVIRTGRRTLVMLAEGDGRFRPAEIQVGRSDGERVAVLGGLQAGERIAASGQFLIDSEASLAGTSSRSLAEGAKRAPGAALHEATGRVEKIDPAGLTLSHGPVPALGWPAMTMTFKLADPAMARGLRSGDQVRIAFDQPPAGPTVRRIEMADAQ
jgi:Cu(I)/Ag(I) efflux system membrane fusion protein